LQQGTAGLAGDRFMILPLLAEFIDCGWQQVPKKYQGAIGFRSDFLSVGVPLVDVFLKARRVSKGSN
jgi:hypothetical protein